MSNYVNYIYLTICEVSLASCKETNFLTYTHYCNSMANKLKAGNLSTRDRRHLNDIYNMLQPIFSISNEEVSNYIVEYFNMRNDRIRDFELAVKGIQEFFPFIGI